MKTEKVLAIILSIGLLLKFFHVPGGNILTILPMLSLSLVYFPCGIYFLSDQKIDQKTIWFSILAGLGLSTTLNGTLFKIMHWPGAAVMLAIGILTLLPAVIISYINYTNPKLAERVPYYKNIFIRTLIVIILLLFSFVL